MPLFLRILRYGISGGAVAGLFGLLVMAALRLWPGIGPVGATILGFCAVQPAGYLIHVFVTFPEAGAAPTGFRYRLPRFVLTNLGGLAVATGGMAIVTDVWHASYVWGVLLIYLLVPAMNFLIYLLWVFNAGASPLTRELRRPS